MLGLACHYNPAEHILLKPELLEWCKRQAPPERRESLFVYWSARHGTFVIGEWLKQPHTWFVDAMNLGRSLANFTRERAQAFVRGLHAPVRGPEIAKMILKNQGDELSRLQDEAGQQSEQFTKALFPED